MKIVKSVALAAAMLFLVQTAAPAQQDPPPQAATVTQAAPGVEADSITEVVAALQQVVEDPTTDEVEQPTVDDVARVLAARVQNAPFSDMRALGVGLVIIGAGFGIGGLARAAVESMARQPETAANVQTAMIIAAALIEGVTFFALIIIMLFTSPY